ncbi:MAG TPA: YggS family pyridoxal phosphate-dependent enzyme [Bacillota bacterium]
MASSIAANLAVVRGRIAGAAARAGRDPAGVTIVAVTKTVGPDVIREAVEAGLTDLGENRAQEFRDKHKLLGPLARWHFIGQLQTNKIKYLVEKVSLIHSLDRMAAVVELDRLAQKVGLQQRVLVEVNVSGEVSKSGVRADEAVALLESMRPFAGVRVCGLMTVAPIVDDPEAARPFFRRLRELAENIRARGWPEIEMSYLSMGMSGDFPVAVEEGANIVRIGTAIFGPRS